MFAGTSATEIANMAVNRRVVALIMTSPSDEIRCDTGRTRNCAMVQSNESRTQNKRHHAEARRWRRRGDEQFGSPRLILFSAPPRECFCLDLPGGRTLTAAHSFEWRET